ncbi:MAG TPA: protein phosphatase 2C domain-containing protein [Candidatus Coprenecus pullistercoris]|nr:protein phosphatase 2C domain-containing protein [Candidatus Coprenecus pullistercoris]
MNDNKISFRLAAYTDPAGKFNESAPKRGNEDDLFVDSDLSNDVQGSFTADKETVLSDAGCLMVVADGMGGMNAGEVASAIAIETVKSAFEPKNLTPDILVSAESRVRYMEKIVVKADAAVKKHASLDSSCEGMGSTLIMAWLYGEDLSVTWCGDSRAYLFREPGGICQISKDHSYVQSLVDNGDITEVEAFDHPYGNIITRNLGDPEKRAEPDSVTLSVCKGDIILLCSDGLSGVLRDRKSYDREGNLIPGSNLEDIIRANRQSMVACREALWAAAEAADWYDNVTAVLCEITQGPVASSSIEGSFINVRIRRKTMRNILVVLVVVVLAAAAAFVLRCFYPGIMSRFGGNEYSVFADLKDSLMNVSESSGIDYIYNKLDDLNVADTVDLAAVMAVLNELDKELDRRCRMKDSLYDLRDEAEHKRLSEVVSKIDEAINQLRTTQDIASIDIGEICGMVRQPLPKSTLDDSEQRIPPAISVQPSVQDFPQIDSTVVPAEIIEADSLTEVKNGCLTEASGELTESDNTELMDEALKDSTDRKEKPITA